MKPDYNVNVCIREDKRMVSKKEAADGKAIVFLNQAFVRGKKLILKMGPKDPNNRKDYLFKLGITTCRPDDVRKSPCHASTACKRSGECGGRSLVIPIYSTRSGGVLQFEKIHHTIHVSGFKNFTYNDTSGTGLSKPDFPFLILSESVSSVTILREEKAYASVADGKGHAGRPSTSKPRGKTC